MVNAVPAINASVPRVNAPVPAVTARVPAASIAEQSPDRQRADSLTIADIYGFAPAFFVASALPVIYEPVNANPTAVSAVSQILRTVRVGDRSAWFFDSYA